jgi:hypothetical protein
VIAGPIVVGGVGGSGTRVVAKILLELGVSLGNDMTQPLDDRWFNLLFYRPAWFQRGSPGTVVGLELMRKRALADHRLSPAEVRFLLAAWRDMRRMGNVSTLPSAWFARRLWRFARSTPADRAAQAWGWKEPISHLLADQVLSQFDSARYIHVIRHGLDMAFSENKQQARRFGALVGVAHVKGQRATPRQLLRYWVRANLRFLEGPLARKPDRACVLNFDSLCRDPRTEVAHLVEFLGLPAGERARDRAAGIPKVPATANRYVARDLGAFDIGDLEAVTRLGFPVEEGSAAVR